MLIAMAGMAMYTAMALIQCLNPPSGNRLVTYDQVLMQIPSLEGAGSGCVLNMCAQLRRHWIRGVRDARASGGGDHAAHDTDGSEHYISDISWYGTAQREWRPRSECRVRGVGNQTGGDVVMFLGQWATVVAIV